MLKLSIDLHPLGSAKDSRTIHTVYIANLLTVTRGRTHYGVWLDDNPAAYLPAKRPKPLLIVKVVREKGIHRLTHFVFKALDKHFSQKGTNT